MGTPRTDWPDKPNRKSIENLLEARISQMASATQRARIPFAMLIIISFTIGAQLYLVKAGWNHRQLRDVDEHRSKVVGNAGDRECPCRSLRIHRYHPGLAENHLEEPSDFDIAAAKAICKDDPADSACAHLLEAEQCLAALDAEYSELVKRRITQQTWEIPILNVKAAVSDIGILGSIAILIIFGYFYAASRREKYALEEFIEIKPAKRRIIEAADRKKFKIGKAGAHWGRLAEPLFSPADHYVAYESVAHRFVFLSSAPDYLLRLFTLSMILLPALIQSTTFAIDLLDHKKWYLASTDIRLRIIVSLALVLFIYVASWRTFSFQNSIYYSLRVWSEIMKGRVQDLVNGKEPDLRPGDEWLSRSAVTYGWVLVVPRGKGDAKPTLVTQGEEMEHYAKPE